MLKNTTMSYEKSFWKESLEAMHSIKKICIASMMAALNSVLGVFRIVVVPKVLIISFASLAVGPCALFCGPLLTGCIGVITDLIKFFIAPDGVFFPGFTFNEFLLGFIYGLFFYRVQKVSFWRCLSARIVVVVLLNLILTPLWLHILYGNSFWVLVSARILKNVLLLPIDAGLLYAIMQLAMRLKAQTA